MSRDRDKTESTEPTAGSTGVPISWFPGHMYKAQKRLAREIPRADIVLEIRDARVPLLSGNPELHELIGQKKHLLLFNKSSLADKTGNRQWQRYFHDQGRKCLFLDADTQSGTNLIFPILRDMMAESNERFLRKKMRPPLYRLMVIGMPNVGKSTFINRLIRKHRLKTAPTPGVTRDISWTNLKDLYMLADSPGIMLPRLPDEKTALILGWIGAIRDHLSGEFRLATSLIQHFSDRSLLKNIENAYSVAPEPKHADAADAHPTGSWTSPDALLAAIAEKRGFKTTGGGFDSQRAAKSVIADFREGRFGPLTIELPPTA